MELFLLLIEFLIVTGVGINAIRAYFEINKIWKRKHEPAVAESVSIVSSLLGLATAIPFLIKFAIVDQDLFLSLDALIGTFIMIIFTMISMGIWVKGNEQVRWFRLFKKSLILEHRESTYLIKELLRPKGAEQILEIFQKIAAIDNEISKEETKLINEFATQWKLPLPNLQVGATEGTTNLIDLRECVLSYLDISPPPEQAAQLVDLLEILIKADNQISHEEELIHAELTGLLNHYIREGDGSSQTLYNVVLVPQSDKQGKAIQTLLPQSKEEACQGGRVYSVGTFYSESYAKEICKKYIALGFYTTFVEC